MKRLRSSDDLHSFADRASDASNRSFSHSHSHRGYRHHHKSDAPRTKGRYDRSAADEERDRSRSPWRRSSDYHSSSSDAFDRRKAFDRYYDSGADRGVVGVGKSAAASSSSSPRGFDRIHRSESFFCAPRRDIPKGFRSERDRSRREGSVSSWRRFKDYCYNDDGSNKSGGDSVRGSNCNKSEQSKVEDRGGGSASWSSLRDAKSPARSKDSGSEQSKSVEVKKSEEAQVQTEMEEGELEPELEQACELPSSACAGDQERKGHDDSDHDHEKVEVCEAVKETAMEDQTRPLPQDDEELSARSRSESEVGPARPECIKENSGVGISEVPSSESAENAVEKVNRLPDCHEDSGDGMRGSGDVLAPDMEADEKDNCLEPREATTVGRSLPSAERNDGENSIDHEADAGCSGRQDRGEEFSKESEVLILNVKTDELSQHVENEDISRTFLPSINDRSVENEACIADGLGNSVPCRDGDDLERPSTRGFELFPTALVKSPGTKEQLDNKRKVDDEKLALEPLDLSLSLPNVLLPISSYNADAAACSSSHVMALNTRLVVDQSGSSTASMSFSGSQQFGHNPNCSLTQNSLDNYEHSVGSHPIFQGVDQGNQATWQKEFMDELKQKEIPFYQRLLTNGNGSSQHSVALQGISRNQTVKSQDLVLSAGNSKTAPGLDRQLSLNKRLARVQTTVCDNVRPPSQSVGTLETGSQHHKDSKQMMKEKLGGSLLGIISQKEIDQVLIGEADFVGTMITMIVSEPVHVTARRFQEMTKETIAYLRESVSGILMDEEKCERQSAYQKSLQKRSDISLEMLLKCPRAQLEIMVALKTGLHDFLQQYNRIPVSYLAEIFMDLRCRNLNCRSLLPVEECDCKICAEKNGFCSSCMCLVCSKFDMASNTCSWVGCDVCLHWCHTDCGLRESLIRNGHRIKGTQEITEVQFHCIACGHPSEMYGFIKEVFQNFARTWPAETLSKELEYVRRIFYDSKDMKGKQLHDMAGQMLSRLAKGSDLTEVNNPILHLLMGAGSTLYVSGPIISGKEQGEQRDDIVRWGHETRDLDSVYLGRAPHLERTASIPPQFDCGRDDKHILTSELRRVSLTEPVFDELESIVRIKQAEANMFQTRADDARREAEGLKRIAVAKNEKIEEDFTVRIRKLRLGETEEMRNQKLAQLQALERAHREYFNMKMRMEADIKDLLLKMESTKQNLAV